MFLWLIFLLPNIVIFNHWSVKEIMALLLWLKCGNESRMNLMIDNMGDDYLAFFQSAPDCAEDTPAWPFS